MGQQFIRSITPIYSVKNIYVKTYNTEENLSLINFLKSENIFSSTLSYKNIDLDLFTNIDVQACVFARDKVPAKLINKARVSINYHPSLLPNYKGCFSVPWAIIAGEPETGYTVHELTEDFGCGDIITQRKVPITSDETSYSLYSKIKSKIIQDLPTHIKILNSKNEILKIKQTGFGQYFPRRLPYDGYINPSWDIVQIDRFIRAMIYPPHPPAKVKLADKEFQILNIQ